MPKRPLRYVFVGAFRARAEDGGVGGQIVACRSLLESPLSQHVKWTLIDSTMATVPPPSVVKRLAGATRRLLRFTSEIFLFEQDGVLIFSSAGLSFVEKGCMAILASARGRRVVFAPRSGLLLDDYARSRFMRVFVPFVLQRCDVIVCQGESWREQFLALAQVAPRRLRIIPNWLDTAPFAEIARGRPVREGPATFLYMGWLEPHKGILDLVDAIAHAGERLAGARFVICGHGSAAARVRERIRETGLSGRVELRGWVTGTDKAAALAEADVLVLPSHREGMPNALLEAMASGLAVIAATAGGVVDVVEDGRNGVLVPPRSVASLADAMAALHTNPSRRRELGRAAQATITARHEITRTWEAVLGALAA